MKNISTAIILILMILGCVSTKPYRKFENPDNLFPIGVNGKWGFVDSIGRIKIEVKFDSTQFFQHGLAVAKKGDKFGYINNEGKWKIKPKYDKAGDFYYSCAETSINSKQLFIKRNGKRNKKCELWNFEVGCLVPAPPVDPKDYSIKKNNKIALTFKNKKDTTEYLYDSVQKFNSDFIVFSKDGKYGFHYIYSHRPNLGEIRLYEPLYDEIRTKYHLWNNKIEDGHIWYAEVKRNGYWGLISAFSLQEVIEPKYISIERNLSSVYILVEFKPNYFGYIDYKGNEYFKR